MRHVSVALFLLLLLALGGASSGCKLVSAVAESRGSDGSTSADTDTDSSSDDDSDDDSDDSDDDSDDDDDDGWDDEDD